VYWYSIKEYVLTSSVWYIHPGKPLDFDFAGTPATNNKIISNNKLLAWGTIIW
jgi:hypothetical protein